MVVEGEVGDVHGAGGLKDGRGNPGDCTVKLQQSFGLIFNQEVSHSTEVEREERVVLEREEEGDFFIFI